MSAWRACVTLWIVVVVALLALMVGAFIPPSIPAEIPSVTTLPQPVIYQP